MSGWGFVKGGETTNEASAGTAWETQDDGSDPMRFVRTDASGSLNGSRSLGNGLGLWGASWREESREGWGFQLNGVVDLLATSCRRPKFQSQTLCCGVADVVLTVPVCPRSYHMACASNRKSRDR